MIVKGNEVKSNRNGKDGLVLAVTKDGKRCKVYVYGSDGVETWVKLTDVTLTVSGPETCWKCNGSGLYYMGGGMLNGKFTGKTGPCFGCGGTGQQVNEDRLRNHYYHHRRSEDYNPAAGEVNGEAVTPVDNRPLAALKRNVSGRVKSGEAEPIIERKAANIAKARERAVKRTVKTAHGERSTTPATDAVERDPLIDCTKCGCLHRYDVACPW